jgi:DNA-3-methyladenine glycosylase I
MTKRPVRPEVKNPARPVVPTLYADGKMRCPWPGVDPLYVAYHDEEWGVPEWESQALFEKLILDGFQAGLSWITILRKRAAFRAAFDDFDPVKMARYTPKKRAALMQDEGIVRNKLKIEAASASARAYLELDAKIGFSTHLWGFVDGKPIQSKFRSMRDIPAQNTVSEKMSKDLKARGFNFVGPTIVYAFMQACGLVNDHLVECFRFEDCAALGKGR